MKTSESIIKIAPALLTAQKKIGAASKDAVNPFFKSKYADLGAVMEACKDALNESEIVALQPIMGEFVETVLLHSSGEWISSSTPITAKVASDPQAMGSAITYARRYGLQSMLFIPAEDDDAERAVSRPAPKIVTPPTSTSTHPDKISDRQVQLVQILLSKKGRTKEELYAKYKVSSAKDLTRAQASTIIDNLNLLEDVAGDEGRRNDK